MSDLCSRLKELRKENSLSQPKIAKQIGLSIRGYQFIEYGEKQPTINIVIKLADFFNVSLDYLVGRSDNPNYGPCNRSE